MHSLEARRQAKGLCPFCGDPATMVVELQVSAKPPEGSGRNRGERQGGVTRRLCDKHAQHFLTLLRNPTARGRRSTDRLAV